MTRRPRSAETPVKYIPSNYALSVRAAVPSKAGCFACAWITYGAESRTRADKHGAENNHATWCECDPAPEHAAEQWAAKIKPRVGRPTFGGL